MPTKPRVEPDLAMQRACRLLATILDSIPRLGCSGKHLRAAVTGKLANDYTPEEIRSAVITLREEGLIDYCNGVYKTD